MKADWSSCSEHSFMTNIEIGVRKGADLISLGVSPGKIGDHIQNTLRTSSDTIDALTICKSFYNNGSILKKGLNR